MPANSLRVVAHIKALPDKVDEVRQLLSGLIAPTRAEEGCVSYELLQNRAEPTDFTFVEEWTSDAALEQHFATEHLQHASARLDGLVAEEPDIRTYSVVG
ncbi:MAG TPA: putative quinol monooxygenase [Pyrinomonadaceae bacterium]